MLYYIYKIPHILKIAYFLRVPLFSCLFLLLFPVIAYWSLPTMLLGLFDLSRGEDLRNQILGWHTASIFLLAVALYFLSWSAVVTAKTFLLYSSDRFGIDHRISIWTTDHRTNRMFFYLSSVLPLPILVLTMKVTFANNCGTAAFWVSLGAILLAIILFFFGTAFVELLHRWLTTVPEDTKSIRRFLFPFGNTIFRRWEESEGLPVVSRIAAWIEARFLRLPPEYLSGYTRGSGEKQRVHPEHVANTVFFATYVLIYLIVGTVVPAYFLWRGFENIYAPSLVNLILIVTVVTWILCAFVFFFDGLRIPALVAVAALLITISGTLAIVDQFVGGGFDCFRPVHFYDGKRDDTNVSKKTPYEMFVKSDKGEAPPFVILVAAEGGGIQAAAWTARVLTGLEAECREVYEKSDRDYKGECSKRIRLISGASGGSVGGMFVAAAYTENGLPIEDSSLNRIVAQASESSLDAVSWGLAYPDNLKNLGIPHPSIWSRGMRLEDQWWRNAPQSGSGGNVSYPLRDAYLSKWGSERWRPSVIFNATVVETGERALITDTRFSFDNDDVRMQEGRQPTFARLTADCGNIDLKVVTAARLSASFPFVTPTARGLFEGAKPGCSADGLHFADGGYHDNFGTASLRDWLEDAVGARKELLDKTRVLIIQIMADSYDPNSGERNARSDFLLQWYSPLVALYNNRVAGQKAASVKTLSELTRYYNESNAPARAGLYPDQRISVLTFKFKGDDDPPLSWHLTPAQKKQIEDRWTKLLNGGDPENNYDPVRDFRDYIRRAASAEKH